MLKKLVLGSLLCIVCLGRISAQGAVPVYFTIQNVVQTQTTYSFDVYAEVGTSIFLLNTYQLYIAYNTAAFGSSVVANGNFSNLLNNNPDITLYDQIPVLNQPKYKLINVVDNTSDILAITADTRLIVPTPACYPADTNTTTVFVRNTPRPVANITFTFTDNTQPPGISLYLTLMVDQFIGGDSTCQLVQGDPSILPAQFLGIDASWQASDQALVSWEVADEPDVQWYEVQKNTGSEDRFESIGRVQAAYLERYYFVDEQASEAQIAYRIKAINHNGDFIFSETAEIRRTHSQAISLYPNPSASYISFKGLSSGDTYDYSIFEVCGKKVACGKLKPAGIQVAPLPSGAYLVELHNRVSGGRIVAKFVRE